VISISRVKTAVLVDLVAVNQDCLDGLLVFEQLTFDHFPLLFRLQTQSLSQDFVNLGVDRTSCISFRPRGHSELCRA
jgi:hypothetical protein